MDHWSNLECLVCDVSNRPLHYIVNRSEINYRNIAIALFVIQMIANLMWPSVFNDAKYKSTIM